MANRIQIPFIVDTLEENPAESGKEVSRPVVGATVKVKRRDTEAEVNIFAAETGEGSFGSVVTDASGRIPGWLPEGPYLLTIGGGKPFIATMHFAWDALSGRGVEHDRISTRGGSGEGDEVEGAVWKDNLRVDSDHNDKQSVLEFLLPTGASLDFRGESAPAGFLLEDGKEYDTTEYNRLFKVIGYKYGGEGTKFKVPDSRGRVNIGAGAGPGLTVRTLAATGGTETVAISAAQLAAHTHGQTSVGGSASVSGSVSGSMGGSAEDHYHHQPENGGSGVGGYVCWKTVDTASKQFLAGTSTPYRGTDELIGTPQTALTLPFTGTTDRGALGVGVSGTLSGSMSGSISTNTGTTNSTGSGEAHANVQPFLVATKIIKT